MGDEATIADLRKRFEAVMDSLPQAELDALEDQRVRHEEDDPRAYYGHDLHAAIGRGYRRRSYLACHAALANTGLAVNDGRGRGDRHRMEFALTLDRLISAAANLGVSADDIIEAMQRKLDTRNGDKVREQVREANEGKGSAW